MIQLSPEDIQAIGLSLQVATSATLLSVIPGFGVAWFFVFSRLPGKTIIEGIINLPLVLPPVVIGYLLLLTFGRNGLLGPVLQKLDISIVFTIKGAIIASAVVGFPLLVRSIRIGLEAIDRNCLNAARTLGASWFDCLLTITIPLCGRAVLAGMTLMFARSLGEFGATIVLAGNIPGLTQTVPLAIYQYTTTPGGDSMALSLCLVSIGLSFIVLVMGELVNKAIRGHRV